MIAAKGIEINPPSAIGKNARNRDAPKRISVSNKNTTRTASCMPVPAVAIDKRQYRISGSPLPGVGWRVQNVSLGLMCMVVAECVVASRCRAAVLGEYLKEDS